MSKTLTSLSKEISFPQESGINTIWFLLLPYLKFSCLEYTHNTITVKYLYQNSKIKLGILMGWFYRQSGILGLC